MHGEQLLVSHLRPLGLGSSPYARGTVQAATTGEQKKRIIPVCTGNRATEEQKKALQEDHPRMHGEQGLKCQC